MRVTVLCQYPFKRMWGGPAVYIDRLTHHISCIKDVELHVITIGDKGKFFKKGNLNVHVVKISKYLRLPFVNTILTLILLKPFFIMIQNVLLNYFPKVNVN
mgnify:CR=1 FL=1